MRVLIRASKNDIMLVANLCVVVVGRGSTARQLAEALEAAGTRLIAQTTAAQLVETLDASDADALVIIATGSTAELQQAEHLLEALPSAQRPVTLVVLSERTLSAFQPSRAIDDFAVWPCTPKEIVVRLTIARWRRTGMSGEGVLRSGELAIDVQRHRVVVGGREVHLTVREYELLLALVRARGTALTREQLLDDVWGPDYLGGPRTVDIHIRRLRAKMPEIAGRIVTVRGVGYRLVAADES